MNTQPPLLPETTFKPLSAKKLDAMITHAMSHQQLPQQSNVIAFRRPWSQQLAFGTGMAAMAASIMFAFMFTPQHTTVATGTNLSESTLTADVSDLILLDSLGA
jgi:hypothetical protein